MTDKTSDIAGADAYPGQEPQATADRELRRDWMTSPEDREPDEYHWALTGHLLSVRDEEPSELFREMGYHDFSRPYAYGTVTVHFNWNAVFQITYSNMALHLVEKRLKRFARDHGWQYEGIVDEDGMPHEGEAIKVSTALGEDSNGIKDWKGKEWGGTDLFDQIDQVDYYGFKDYPDETNPNDPRACSDCGELLPDYNAWRTHVLREHVNPDRRPPAYPQPVVDLDDVLPAGINKGVMDETVQRQARLIAKLGAPSPKVNIPGPIPFIYDIEQDRIFVGHPGERHADIQGRFTPGGLVEGVYDPKGNVQIRTDTDMPYTVRHMIELWYALHPELWVKSLYLLVGEKRYRLAAKDIGHTVRNLAATDPAAWAAYEALAPHGNVYVVGGAVRDVALGKLPKDIDLLVQGVEGDDVAALLEALPGRVDYTGKAFGVYRYRNRDGSEVEIALPRVERSTGDQHTDFEVDASPFLPVQDDLARRDFTVNAMAVNLATGELVDPYGGKDDIRAGRLRAVSDTAFLEDPLRMLRGLVAMSRFGLAPDSDLERQFRLHGSRLGHISPERVQVELDKLLAGDQPHVALRYGLDTDLVHHFLPEVAATRGFDQQNKHHNKVLDDHLLKVLQGMVEQGGDADMRLAALLHDIGKPASQWIDEDGWAHYYENERGEGADHEVVGANMTRDLLTRLRYPNERIDRVTHLVRHHMFPAFSSMGGARKFLNRVGDQHADDLLTLRWADNGGKPKGHDKDVDVNRMRQLVDKVREARQPTDKSMLAINGHDLIQSGHKPGPHFTHLFDHLVQRVLERPELNTRGDLLNIAQDWMDAGQPKFANILDPIHESLDEDVFDNADDDAPRLKPKLASYVRSKVFKVLRDAEWPDPTQYLSFVLTGSLTTYQWSEESDFDVSLFVDTEKFPEYVRADLIKLMIEHCDGTLVPGTTHPLQVFVVPHGITREHLYKPGLRSAYDIEADEWIVLPERERSVDVYKRWPELIAYAKMVEDKMRMMLKYNPHAAKQYWHLIHEKRRSDMKAGKGDYSESNIVYKWLANRGYFPLISEVTGEYIA